MIKFLLPYAIIYGVGFVFGCMFVGIIVLRRKIKNKRKNGGKNER